MFPERKTKGSTGRIAPSTKRAKDAPAATHGEPPSSPGSIPSSSRACVSSAVCASRHQRVRDVPRLARGESLLLVDERELGALRVGVRLDVAPLDRELALAQLAARLDRDPLAHRHRARARDQARDAGDQDVASTRRLRRRHPSRGSRSTRARRSRRAPRRAARCRRPHGRAGGGRGPSRWARRGYRRPASPSARACPASSSAKVADSSRYDSFDWRSRSRMIGRTTVSPKSPASLHRIARTLAGADVARVDACRAQLGSPSRPHDAARPRRSARARPLAPDPSAPRPAQGRSPRRRARRGATPSSARSSSDRSRCAVDAFSGLVTPRRAAPRRVAPPPRLPRGTAGRGATRSQRRRRAPARST